MTINQKMNWEPNNVRQKKKLNAKLNYTCIHHAEVLRHPQGLREVFGLGRLAVCSNNYYEDILKDIECVARSLYYLGRGLDSYHDDDDSATLRRLELELYED